MLVVFSPIFVVDIKNFRLQLRSHLITFFNKENYFVDVRVCPVFLVFSLTSIF